MWLRDIAKTKLPAQLLHHLRRPENRKLRTAALAAVALLSVNLVLYGAVAAPSALTLADLASRQAALRKRHAEAVLFQKQRESYAGIRAGIPTQKDMPLLVKDLVQKARSLNLSVGSISYDIPQHGREGLSVLSFSFPAEGTYPSVKRFIYEIESSDRIIGIQELKLDSDRGRVKLQMKLVTYIRAGKT